MVRMKNIHINCLILLLKMMDTAWTTSPENQKPYLTVTAEIDENANATLLSRKLQNKIDKYKAPGGYEVKLSGDATQTTDMLKQMGKALALGFMLIYLVMVAQFQSLLSPFIVIFTVPLAFTGGMIGLGFLECPSPQWR